MSEWWTYRPADFLMFAPQTYWRLFELHNAAWWPAPLLWLAGALGWQVAMARPQRAAGVAARVGAAGLAVAWAAVAGTFVLQRYAPINWAAAGFAIGFFVQAAALLLLASRRDLQRSGSPTGRAAGRLLWFVALLVHPLLPLLAGRPLAQAELFGLAPDPTVIATLGALLQFDASGRTSRILLTIAWTLALAWCAVSAATLATLGSWQAAVPSGAALLAAATAIARPGTSARRHTRI